VNIQCYIHVCSFQKGLQLESEIAHVLHYIPVYLIYANHETLKLEIPRLKLEIPRLKLEISRLRLEIQRLKVEIPRLKLEI
jgi:hypothetical protein